MTEEEKQGEVIEYFDDRFYKMVVSEQTIYLPSSTTILNIVSKPWLATWRGDIGNELANFKSRKAMLKGSLIHDAIHQLWEGAELTAGSFEQDEWVQIVRFKQWHGSLKPALAGNPEMTVYSLEQGYAGTLDFAIRIKAGKYNIGLAKEVELEEGIYIGDLKTGTVGDDKNYFRQLASYDYAYTALTEEQPVGAFILHTQAKSKSGFKMVLRNREEINADFESFIHAKELWISENPAFNPKIMDLPVKISLYDKKEAI